MRNIELNVDINVEFRWLNPPKSLEEEINRKQVNLIVASLATKFNDGLKVILLQMIAENRNTKI